MGIADVPAQPARRRESWPDRAEGKPDRAEGPLYVQRTRLTVQRVLCTSWLTGLTVQRKCRSAPKVGTQYIYFEWSQKYKYIGPQLFLPSNSLRILGPNFSNGRQIVRKLTLPPGAGFLTPRA